MLRSFTLLLVLVAADEFVELHDPTGGRILLNVHEITSMRSPVGPTPPGTNCAVYMSNGNTIGVRESCEDVRNAIILAR